MALNPTISTSSKNAALDAITALIGSSATLKVYDGSQPAGPNTAVSTQTMLVSCALAATPFGAASSGVSTAGAISSGSPAASGTAAWFRIATSGGTAILDGTVGTSGCDLNLGSTTISTGVPVTITSLTLTHP